MGATDIAQQHKCLTGEVQGHESSSGYQGKKLSSPVLLSLLKGDFWKIKIIHIADDCIWLVSIF